MQSQHQRGIAEGLQSQGQSWMQRESQSQKTMKRIRNPNRESREFQTCSAGDVGEGGGDWKAHICWLLRQLAPDITASYREALNPILKVNNP